MRVEVVITPKLTKTIVAARVNVSASGVLLCYADKKMTQLIEGFKTWRRFNVLEETALTNLVPVNLNAKKNKKGA